MPLFPEVPEAPDQVVLPGIFTDCVVSGMDTGSLEMMRDLFEAWAHTPVVVEGDTLVFTNPSRKVKDFEAFKSALDQIAHSFPGTVFTFR